MDEEHHYSSMDMSIATEPFILVTEPHPKRVEGFPFRHKNNDKYDVLITTDVLAEGINLHRSNALINYDLPFQTVLNGIVI